MKTKTAIICTSIFLINGCGGEDNPTNETSILYNKVKYDNLSVYRDDQIKNRLDFQNGIESFNGTEDRDWANLAYSRSAIKLDYFCDGFEGEKPFEKPFHQAFSNGFIVDYGLYMSADHAANVYCDEAETILADVDISFVNDRYLIDDDGNYNYIDEVSPGDWMLRNRIFAMSMYETNTFDISDSKEDLSIRFTSTKNQDIEFQTVYPDMDISMFNAPEMEIKTTFTGVGVFKDDLSPTIFFDRINIPRRDSELMKVGSNNPLWMVSVHYDPELMVSSNSPIQFETTSGEWNNSPYQNQSSIIKNIQVKNDDAPISHQVSYGKTEFLELQSDFNQTCNPNYSEHCFFASLDNLYGHSGSAVLHRKYGSVKAYLSGILVGGPSNDTPHWTLPNNLTYSLPIEDKEKLSRVVSFDNALMTEYNNKIGSVPEPESVFDDKPTENTECIGDCSSSQNSIFKTFVCAQSFNSGSVSNWYSDWPKSRAVGIVGGPNKFNNSSDNIDGISTLGLICKNSDNISHLSKIHWQSLKVIGKDKTYDPLKSEPNILSGAKFNDYIQQSYLRLEFSNVQPDHSKINLRPAPMKMCPHKSSLTGLYLIIDSNNNIKGISKIECGIGGKREKYSLDGKVINRDDLSQYIGRPYKLNGESEVRRGCSQNKFVEGFKIHDDDSSKVKGVELICR